MTPTPPKSLKSPIPKSKYEFNLAEFPVTILSKRLPQGLKVIEYQDTIIGKDGQVIPRKWKVSPSAEYGFGSNQALATLFELFQIWKEQGFKIPAIRFESIYNLVKRMDLENASPNYERLRKDLNALVGITIEAKNAFWDNEKKAYIDQTFHLFERVRFYRKEGPGKQQALPFAFIEASKELWGSIETNALITLKVDSEFFYSLTPTQQRLALYLGKMLHSATEHRRDVPTLTSQLPILAKNPRDAKKLLTRACEGLLEKNFPYLTNYRYERKRDGQGENIVFLRKETKERTEFRSHNFKEAEEDKARRDLLVQDVLAVTNDPKNELFYHILARKLPEHLIYRAISETKDASRNGEIRTTRARYFTDTVKRLAAEQGIALNLKKERGGDPP